MTAEGETTGRVLHAANLANAAVNVVKTEAGQGSEIGRTTVGNEAVRMLGRIGVMSATTTAAKSDEMIGGMTAETNNAHLSE